MAAVMNVSVEALEQKVHSLKEMNPMLGHRGCRLGISYPEIYEMQARAIFGAVVKVAQKGISLHWDTGPWVLRGRVHFNFFVQVGTQIATQLTKGRK